MKELQVVLDCEGPITQNDNAFELCEAFLPDGGAFFSRISLYDDFLADVDKRPGYKAGDTLKLILPFLKAFGVSNSLMQTFSARTLVMLPYAREMLEGLGALCNTFIISTSYRQYLEALCAAAYFDMKHIYCTDVDMDVFDVSIEESSRLKDIAMEITMRPVLKWYPELSSRADLPSEIRQELEWLDSIFWDEIPSMQTGKAFALVNPVGGLEKANCLRDSIRQTGISASSVFYAGDSITDVQALSFARQEGGVALSFNGNRYALQAAGYACISPTPYVIFAIARMLAMEGVEGFHSLFMKRANGINGFELLDILQPFLSQDELMPVKESSSMISLFRLEGDFWKKALPMSEEMRKNVRGQKVGALG